MTDLSKTIIPKSDQLNSDDLIGKSITIKITNVSAVAGDQPIAVNYEGDGGKPYKPCKGMRRVLVMLWGVDGKAYIGRSMTLYRDPDVKFGGIKVGGIRISHMSHINEEITVALTESRASRKPFKVRPLAVAASNAPAPVPLDKAKLLADAQVVALTGSEKLRAWWTAAGGPVQKLLEADLPALKETASKADAPGAENAVAQNPNKGYEGSPV